MNEDPKGLANWTLALEEEDMPIFSNTASQIQSVLSDDKKGAMELASVIMQDPNLTAKLLKMSNSIHYNPSSKKMVTVSRSIVVLGCAVIRELTLACSFLDTILSQSNKTKANEEIAIAIHAAVQARALAVLMRDSSPEEVFIAALLHNIGAISFWCFNKKQGNKILAQIRAGKTEPEAEQEILNFKLSALSYELCRNFKFTGLIKESINNVKNNRTKLVNLSIQIARESQFGWDSEAITQCLNELKKLTSLPTDSLTTTLKKNTNDAIQIAQQFGANNAAHIIQRHAQKSGTTHKVIPETVIAPIPENPQQLQFQILQDISNLLTDKINLNLLFETVVEGIHRSLCMDRSCFMLVTHSKNKLSEKFSFGWHIGDFQEKITFTLSDNPPNLFYYVSHLNSALWATPDKHQPYYTSYILNTVGNVECFLLPLYSESKFIGLIYADRAIHNKKLTQEDFNAAKLFVQQASLGLNLYRTHK